MQRAFDIWLHGFARDTLQAPLAISRVFGIPVQAAEALVASLPRVVKRDASENQAERLVRALESIGGVAEAIPTRVVPTPVLVVGTQPAPLRPETLVRHAPRAAAPREHAALESVALSSASSGETLRLGTQELAAFQLRVMLASQALEAEPSGATGRPREASPDATLVDPVPHWAERQSAPPTPSTSTDATPEPRGRWDDIELAPPSELEPPISLAPPAQRDSDAQPTPADDIEITRNAHSWLQKVAQGPIQMAPLSSHPPPASDKSWITLTPHPVGSNGPPAWKNPMALPPRDLPIRSLGMRTAAERARFARARSQHPPSLQPAAQKADSQLGEALEALSRGELQNAARTAPTLAFAFVLVGVTLAFMLAYAAW